MPVCQPELDTHNNEYSQHKESASSKNTEGLRSTNNENTPYFNARDASHSYSLQHLVLQFIKQGFPDRFKWH